MSGNNSFSCEACPGIPGHALHEKGLQRQIGVVTLVSSQERRALAVSLINRLSTADETVVNGGFCSSVGFKYELDCSCFRRDVQDSCLRYLGGHERQISPGRTEPSTSLPARPCAASPRPAPTRPWYVRVLDSTGYCECRQRDVLYPNVDIEKFFKDGRSFDLVASTSVVTCLFIFDSDSKHYRNPCCFCTESSERFI